MKPKISACATVSLDKFSINRLSALMTAALVRVDALLRAVARGSLG
jgi:hypothetical protein